MISGGLAFSGVASEFTFDNDGLIEIGDNPFGIDRAVSIILGGFPSALNPAFLDDAVAETVAITNGGTIDGGIEVEAITRNFSFVNTGQINAVSSDPYAEAVELSSYDWRDVPGEPEKHHAETFLFDNQGEIGGAVFLDAEASLITITNSGTVEQGVRPGHGVFVNQEAKDAFQIYQETILDAELEFENTGTISNEDYGGGAIFIRVEAGRPDTGVAGSENASSTVTFTNSGSILSSGGNYVTLPVNGRVQIGQTGLHYATALGIDVAAEGASSISITNEVGGLIDASGEPHIGNMAGPQTAPGDPVEGAGGIAIAAHADEISVVNHGTIRGTSTGGALVVGETTIIPLNIDHDFEGVTGGAIDLFNSIDTVTNSATGVIEGGIALRQGDDNLTNAGTITGDIWLGSGFDTLDNTGTITGTVWAGLGNDTFTNNGRVVGNVDMGQGRDTFHALGEITGNVTMGDDNDVFITFLGGAGTRFGGTIDGGAGVGDSFIFLVTPDSGGALEEMSGVTMTGFEYVALGGNGSFTSDGTSRAAVQLSTGDLTFAEGAVFNASGTYAFLGDGDLVQTLTNLGTINGSVSLGTQNDTFKNYGTLNGDLLLGTGDDTFIHGVDAVLTGTANGGEGNDTFVLDLGNGGTLTSNIYSKLVGFEVLTTIGTGTAVIEGSSGTDQYNNEGTINNNVNLGGGDDSFNNVGVVNGEVDLGNGNNTFVNAPGATINGNIIAAEGNDQVANSGEINGTVDLGDGDNTFANAPTAVVNGDIAAGTGNDIVINQGTINGDVFLDGPQQLPQSLGTLALRAPLAGETGGNDTFKHSGTVTGSIDMGRGNDRLELSGAWTLGGMAFGGLGDDTLSISFAHGASEQAPHMIEFDQFDSFETLEVVGGTGKFEGEVSFETVDIRGGRLIGAKGSNLLGDVQVHNGGTFGSAGTVTGDIFVAQGGTLSPGASPEVMTVIGDVSLAAGSITHFEFVPAPGQSDQLLIDGDLVIAPGAVLNLSGERPLTPGVAYDLVVADSITGTFTIGSWDNSAIQGFLSYRQGSDADRLQLLGTFVASGAVSPQADAAIDYVNAVLIAGDASAALLNAVPDLLDGNGYANAAAFAKIGPEAYASAGQLGVERGLGISKAFRAGAGIPTGVEARPFTFATGFGDWRTLKGGAASGTSTAKNETWGVLGGIGIGSETASIAAFVGYLDSQQKIGALDARTDADGVSAGVTGQVSSGGFHAGLRLGQGRNDAGSADSHGGLVRVSPP